ncbi:MAG TPA: hypothetical protein VH044_16450 [Polyangiaceae bacterium]|nr:hypothetical protein [Polyangiaceae bacterium]
MEAIQRSASLGQHIPLEPFDPGDRPGMADEMKKPAGEPLPTIHAPSPNR